jgi:hypothetical protein
MRVLILGGYGHFGGRLAALLANDRRLTLLIAGRSLERATDFCAQLAGGAPLEPVRFERAGFVFAQLREVTPHLVVDASGPFQDYGDDPYAVVKACIALNIDYLDLADSVRFVAGVARFDEEARAHNTLVLSGVSSFPALTAAVVRTVSAGLSRVDTVAAGIAPSPRADIGLSVYRAIASYAGKPVALIRDGQPATACGLVDGRDFTIAPPGRLPLARRRFLLVEVPDLAILPALWPQLRSVWTGAAPAPALANTVLATFARLVRWRLLRSLVPFAATMQRLSRRVRWGEHRGGMFVAVSGIGPDGQPVERAWHMIVEGDDGPIIPAMPAAAIIGRILDGRRPQPGARSAATDLALADYRPLFAQRRIVDGVRESGPTSQPLFRRLLGDAFDALPAPLRHMHDFRDTLSADGRACVERGGWLASRIADLIGFPRPADDIAVTVEFRREDDGEHWRRDFGGQVFASLQTEGSGRFERLLCERFGRCVFGLAMVVEDGLLRMIVRRWSLAGVPMPRWLAPDCVALEREEDGRFAFFVALSYPVIGLIVRYQGWLAPRPAADETAPAAAK